MPEPEREMRVLTDCEFVVARADDGDLPKLTGYAALFNKRTELWDGFFESIAPGAFARTLKEGADVRALFNHNPDKVLGRNTTEPPTLSLEENSKGLRVEIMPPDTETGREVVALVQRGDVSQMSFAFRTVKESFEDKGKEGYFRVLEDVELFDVSPVTYPAYPDTSIAARGFEERTGKTPETPGPPKPEPAKQDAGTRHRLAYIDELLDHENGPSNGNNGTGR